LFRELPALQVNIANITQARSYYSTDVMKIPQGEHGLLAAICMKDKPANRCNCDLARRIGMGTLASMLARPAGQGSGFVWDDRGHIVTNFHVIRGASEVQVSLIDQTTWPAKIVGGEALRQLQLTAAQYSLPLGRRRVAR
jgi:S1-C subfamily serine protease